MPESPAPTRSDNFTGNTVTDNARAHIGHVFGNVIHNYHASYNEASIWSLAQAITAQLDAATDDREKRLVRASGKDAERDTDEVAVLSQKMDLILSVLMPALENKEGRAALDPSMLVSRRKLEIASIIDLAACTGVPSPDAVLRLRSAYLKRHRKHFAILFDRFWTTTSLSNWTESTGSEVLLIQGSWSTHKETDAIGTQMMQFVKQNGVMLLAALDSPGWNNGEALTWNQVLKHLAHQALQKNMESLTSSLSDDFLSQHVARAESDDDWESILLSALSGVSLAYILLDLSLIEESSVENDAGNSIVQSIARLLFASREVPILLKVAVLSQRKTHTISLQNGHCLNVDSFIRRDKGKKMDRDNRRGAASSRRAMLTFRSRPARK